MHVTAPGDSGHPQRVEFGVREWMAFAAFVILPAVSIFGWAWTLNGRMAVMESILATQTRIVDTHQSEIRSSAVLAAEIRQQLVNVQQQITDLRAEIKEKRTP